MDDDLEVYPILGNLQIVVHHEVFQLQLSKGIVLDAGPSGPRPKHHKTKGRAVMIDDLIKNDQLILYF